MEKTNARFVEQFEQSVSLIVIDASFISLKILLPVAKKWYGEEGGRLVALIKPQFEAGREDAAKGEGVIRDPALHKQILEDILNFAQNEDFEVQGLIRSPLLGPKGNTEFLVNLQYPGKNRVEVARLVAEVVNP
jgi:23S rRNA (cytidine1920-2'-O)/16S rRNA (cytidine1409-2'-O)-methyltransferase